MSHPRGPGFNHKTGDPTFDNQSRNLNRRMWRETQLTLHFTTPRGRRRLKQLKRIEGGLYIQAVAATMRMLADRDQGARRDAETMGEKR